MNALRRRIVFATGAPGNAALGLTDLLILLALAVIVVVGATLAVNSPKVLNGPDISLAAGALPYYALLSVYRMTAAYVLSMLFSLAYGYLAANNPNARLVMLPVLDILQSTPILSFLPVVVLGLTAILPQGIAVEFGAVLLIFTSQAWNMTYSFYQSMTTQPNELKEASAIFRFNWWWRFRRLELPFAAIGLLWNSVMSWAGGWFFLMAAETFRVGDRDFRLPGLGSYLQKAADQNNTTAILYGIITLVLVVVLLDQLVWRPLLAWADKFKVEMVESDNPPTSWFLDFLGSSRLAGALHERVIMRLVNSIDKRLGRSLRAGTSVDEDSTVQRTSLIRRLLLGILLLVMAYGVIQLGLLLISVPLDQYLRIAVGAVSTGLRVAVALVIALLWTVPLGVAIGSNARLATFLQPLVQIAASIPATAFFPIIVLALISAPGLIGTDVRLNVAAVVLMLLGTQWYVLFNVIAGASAIPQDLKYTTDLLRLNRVERWRKLILPSLFPYLVTGLITAGGGAWNASIVAEYTTLNDQSYSVTGLGALIKEATDKGNFPMLAAATLVMILVVVSINRYFWRRLYRLAEEKYRME